MSRAWTQNTASAAQVSSSLVWWQKLPLRISVRALMIFVLCLGGLLGWVVHSAQVQREAVAAIRAGGGQVTYDWQLTRLPGGNEQFDPTARPKAPKWLLDCLGPDYFGHVDRVQLGPRDPEGVMKHLGQLDRLRRINFFTGIDFSPLARAGLNSLPNTGLTRFKGLVELVTTDFAPPPFNGANFKHLRHMARLEYLNLPDKISVIDADLIYLSKLTALVHLRLDDPHVSDAGLVSLKDMTKLTFLGLSNTQVSGAGLTSLRAMSGLEFLDLSQTQVDDLSSIGHLTRLVRLNLARTPIDDAGLAPIAGLTGLNHLQLNGTNVTSVSFATLKHLTKLQSLSLAQAKVGDDGSEAVSELTVLTHLNLSDTQITDNTLARLSALPKLRSLSVDRTAITDRGLATLIRFQALRVLTARKTKISSTGLKAFRIARPKVRVTN
jgi:Leucine-rich repeat (LRR) protein